MTNKQGHDKLWSWFSLTYSSWLTLPRVLMHEMPDEWQSKMADLMREWDEHWDFSDIPFDTTVQLKENGKYVQTPEWLSNYRHPIKKDIAILKKASEK